MCIKKIVGQLCKITGLSRFARVLLGKTYTRVVNYHKVDDHENFKRQLDFYSKNFQSTDLPFRKYKKPGIILTFDDGLSSHYKASKIIEKYGFCGWFFISPGLIGKKGYLTWKQVTDMAKKHHIGCHTMNHTRITEHTDLQKEIIDAKNLMEKKLSKVDSFAWVGGELAHYTKNAHELIKKKFKYVFQTISRPYRGGDPQAIPRTNIESYNSMTMVEFQLSGIMDIVYLPKRQILDRKLH